jgi:hypothetical protein
MHASDAPVPDAREARLLELRTSAAIALATDLDACRALLFGARVPVHRLDERLVAELDLDEPSPDGDGVVLDLDLVEQVILRMPSPRRVP